MKTVHAGSLVARGNTSDVYRWGKHAVVKVLRPGIPDEWATLEAQTSEAVHAAGLPAPAVLDLTTVDGRPGIVLELVAGGSMWEQMLDAPDDIPQLALLLAELQAEVNATPAPLGLPRLVDRLRANIGGESALTASERELALADLGRRPDGDMLCHFDVHPNNVLMGPTQPLIIDWFDAAAGAPGADVVRSSILMRCDAAAGHMPCVDPSVIDVVHDQYVAAVVRVRDLAIDELLAWEPAVLASRLGEPLPRSIRRTTHIAWRAATTAERSRLAASLRRARGD